MCYCPVGSFFLFPLLPVSWGGQLGPCQIWILVTDHFLIKKFRLGFYPMCYCNVGSFFSPTNLGRSAWPMPNINTHNWSLLDLKLRLGLGGLLFLSCQSWDISLAPVEYRYSWLITSWLKAQTWILPNVLLHCGLLFLSYQSWEISLAHAKYKYSLLIISWLKGSDLGLPHLSLYSCTKIPQCELAVRILF